MGLIDKHCLPLARIRCVVDCVTRLHENQPLPEALCYIPAEVHYKVASALGVNQIKLPVYPYPCTGTSPSSEDGGASRRNRPDVTNETRPSTKYVSVDNSTGGVYLTGEEVSNVEGQWIRMSQRSIDELLTDPDTGTPPYPVVWVQMWWEDCSGDKLELCDCKSTTGPGRCCSDERSTTDPVLNSKGPTVSEDQVIDEELTQRSPSKLKKPQPRWNEVVEATYSLKLGRPSTIPAALTDSVKRLQVAPQGWTHQHEEELAQFLCERVLSDNKKLGNIEKYVSQVLVSSYTDSDSVEHLTDNNHATFWESDGRQGLHWIRLMIRENIIIQQLMIDVDNEDDTYVPQRVVVMGGPTTHDLKKLNDVTLSTTGYIGILEDMSEHYPVIEIRIKECREGGIDCRVHGIIIQSLNEKNIGLRMEIFAENKLTRYPRLQSFTEEQLYCRMTALQRLMTLYDSIIHIIIPHWSTTVDTFHCLKKIRPLLPLSKKRRNLIDMFLKESETRRPADLLRLYINRRAALEHRQDPLLDPSCRHTVFMQVYEAIKPKIDSKDTVDFRWPSNYDQWWECKFVSEGIIDQGGGFRDSLSDIAEELCPADSVSPIPLPFFVRAPNQFRDMNCDVYTINPSNNQYYLYEWIGMLLGACLRGLEQLPISLPSLFWKRLCGDDISWYDYVHIDAATVDLLHSIEAMSREVFDTQMSSLLTFTTTLSNETSVELRTQADSVGSNVFVTYDNRMEYIRLVKDVKMSEGLTQLEAICTGFLKVVPRVVLDLLTWKELERKVCGDPEVSVEALKSSCQLDSMSPDDKSVLYLWQSLSSFTNEERSKFLRFVTGRRRLPATIYICGKGSSEVVDSLPESSTCSRSLLLPEYTSAKVAEAKIRYAIYNCVAIDTDKDQWDE